MYFFWEVVKITVLLIAGFVITFLTSALPTKGLDLFSTYNLIPGYETVPKGLPFAFTEEQKVYRTDIPVVNECGLEISCVAKTLAILMLDAII